MSSTQLVLLGTPPDTSPHAHDGSRIALDRYYTPDDFTRAALLGVEEKLGKGAVFSGTVWEAHVGAGAWSRAALQRPQTTVWVSDLDPEAPGLNLHAYPGRRPARVRAGVDFLHDTIFEAAPDWILGNPPFKDAVDHVLRARARTGRHVLFLLRLAFVEAGCRIRFWAENPARHIWSLAQRPSFVAEGTTDSCPYGLFWWDAQHTGDTTFTPCWDWKAMTASAPALPL